MKPLTSFWVRFEIISAQQQLSRRKLDKTNEWQRMSTTERECEREERKTRERVIHFDSRIQNATLSNFTVLFYSLCCVFSFANSSSKLSDSVFNYFGFLWLPLTKFSFTSHWNVKFCFCLFSQRASEKTEERNVRKIKRD